MTIKELDLCPLCKRKRLDSEGWCNACHGLTTVEPAPGMRWVHLHGGSVNAGRLVTKRYLPDTYYVAVYGETYYRQPGTFDYYLEGPDHPAPDDGPTR